MNLVTDHSFSHCQVLKHPHYEVVSLLQIRHEPWVQYRDKVLIFLDNSNTIMLLTSWVCCCRFLECESYITYMINAGKNRGTGWFSLKLTFFDLVLGIDFNVAPIFCCAKLFQTQVMRMVQEIFKLQKAKQEVSIPSS